MGVFDEAMGITSIGMETDASGQTCLGVIIGKSHGVACRHKWHYIHLCAYYVVEHERNHR